MRTGVRRMEDPIGDLYEEEPSLDHMHLRTLGCAVAVLCFVGTSGLASAQDQRPGAEAAIEDLLQKRARSLLERDRAAFLSTVYPGAPAYRREQASLFDRLAVVPLADLRYSADWETYGDLARPTDEKRYPDAEEIRIPLTVKRYRLRGYDKQAVIEDVYLTFVEDEGEWFVGGEDDLRDIGIETQKDPWDLDKVVLTEGHRILAVSSGCGKVVCDGVAELLTAARPAMARVDAYWDRPWNRAVPFFAPGDPDDLAAIIQATFSVDNYVAFAFWTGGAGKSEGARIIASPDAFATSSFERTFSVLAHELFHVATLPYRGSFMPRFLDEGFAQYVQYDAAGQPLTIFDAAVVASGDIDLPQDYEFFIGDSSDVQLVYQKSLSAISFLAERWGQDAVARLYRAIGSASSLEGTAEHHVDQGFRDVTGMNLDAFEKAWASSIVAP